MRRFHTCSVYTSNSFFFVCLVFLVFPDTPCKILFSVFLEEGGFAILKKNLVIIYAHCIYSLTGEFMQCEFKACCNREITIVKAYAVVEQSPLYSALMH